jgi:predicted small integral membrane protein
MDAVSFVLTKDFCTFISLLAGHFIRSFNWLGFVGHQEHSILPYMWKNTIGINTYFSLAFAASEFFDP